MELEGVVYILTNRYNNVLYTGVTRDLRRRIAEHKLRINQGFSAKYKTEKLVYYEWYERLDVAIRREKQLKKWHRDWKEKLIKDFNPEWRDLAEDVGADEEYIQAVKEAYECGQYAAGEEMPDQVRHEEIAGQARDEGKGRNEEWCGKYTFL